ncbi:tRNA(Phe) 7-[(3-amino-3-carboxypropyl)-4-demethylwyosine(37)-N(4)]-methyltransferase [Plasmodiophora brassicae]|uniref:tRNA wybutosine-synthesizing protein 3 n=1 Tax=Plasmodiophora brassicae TaxID=37360 RepID=A0A3P3YAI5_PLABS|nr:unnamed protein product [Plasmodiophora brassicae]
MRSVARAAAAAASFDERKRRILSCRGDKSPKGSIDDLVLPIMDVVNQCDDFVTTSSCSGRVAVYVDCDPEDVSRKVKKGGVWLFVSHDALPVDDVVCTIFPRHSEGDGTLRFCVDEYPDASAPLVYFKFEPFILHVASRSEQAAQAFLATSLRAGYGNSGIQKLNVQVRDTLKLDVPIGTYSGDTISLFVSKPYIELLSRLANDKFRENVAKLDRYQAIIASGLVFGPSMTSETRAERIERNRSAGMVAGAGRREQRRHARDSDSDSEPSAADDEMNPFP